MADDPDDDDAYALLQTARTPQEAALLRALLEGAGIPAHVEGTMLADEFALSQRLMNTQGVRVFVPREHVAAARDVLAEAKVDDDELERQALAAAPAPEADRPRDPGRGGPSWGLTIGLGALAFLFFAMWMGGSQANARSDPLFVMESDASTGTVTWRWRASGAVATRQIDRDLDGIWEQTYAHDRQGALLSSSFDEDENGIPERHVEHRPGGLGFVWLDDDGDGRTDRCRIEDQDGRVIRTLRYAGREGFVEDEGR